MPQQGAAVALHAAPRPPAAFRHTFDCKTARLPQAVVAVTIVWETHLQYCCRGMRIHESWSADLPFACFYKGAGKGIWTIIALLLSHQKSRVSTDTHPSCLIAVASSLLKTHHLLTCMQLALLSVSVDSRTLSSQQESGLIGTAQSYWHEAQWSSSK